MNNWSKKKSWDVEYDKRISNDIHISLWRNPPCSIFSGERSMFNSRNKTRGSRKILSEVHLSKHSARWVPKYGTGKHSKESPKSNGWKQRIYTHDMTKSIKMFYYWRLRCIGAFMQIMEVIFMNGTCWNNLFHENE